MGNEEFSVEFIILLVVRFAKSGCIVRSFVFRGSEYTCGTIRHAIIDMLVRFPRVLEKKKRN